MKYFLANLNNQLLGNETVGQQCQLATTTQINNQQCKTKKITQPTGISTIIQQSPQIIIPQRFEMSSQSPITSKITQYRKKVSQEVESTSTPVFIVQKLDNPVFIRQPQAKIR